MWLILKKTTTDDYWQLLDSIVKWLAQKAEQSENQALNNALVSIKELVRLKDEPSDEVTWAIMQLLASGDITVLQNESNLNEKHILVDNEFLAKFKALSESLQTLFDFCKENANSANSEAYQLAAKMLDPLLLAANSLDRQFGDQKTDIIQQANSYYKALQNEQAGLQTLEHDEAEFKKQLEQKEALEQQERENREREAKKQQKIEQKKQEARDKLKEHDKQAGVLLAKEEKEQKVSLKKAEKNKLEIKARREANQEQQYAEYELKRLQEKKQESKREVTLTLIESRKHFNTLMSALIPELAKIIYEKGAGNVDIVQLRQSLLEGGLRNPFGYTYKIDKFIQLLIQNYQDDSDIEGHATINNVKKINEELGLASESISNDSELGKLVAYHALLLKEAVEELQTSSMEQHSVVDNKPSPAPNPDKEAAGSPLDLTEKRKPLELVSYQRPEFKLTNLWIMSLTPRIIMLSSYRPIINTMVRLLTNVLSSRPTKPTVATKPVVKAITGGKVDTNPVVNNQPQSQPKPIPTHHQENPLLPLLNQQNRNLTLETINEALSTLPDSNKGKETSDLDKLSAIIEAFELITSEESGSNGSRYQKANRKAPDFIQHEPNREHHTVKLEHIQLLKHAAYDVGQRLMNDGENLGSLKAQYPGLQNFIAFNVTRYKPFVKEVTHTERQLRKLNANLYGHLNQVGLFAATSCRREVENENADQQTFQSKFNAIVVV